MPAYVVLLTVTVLGAIVATSTVGVLVNDLRGQILNQADFSAKFIKP